MKVQFEANQLEKILKDVVRIIPASAKTNNYKFVRITVDKNESRVDFVTTSSDVSIRRTLFDTLVQSPATILESGVCVLPARDLLEIVKRASDTVELTVKASHVDAMVTFGKAKFEVRGQEPNGFTPYQNDPEETNRIQVPAVALRSLLEQTTYACSLSETRPILTGVNFRIHENTLYAVATDGLRLGKMQVQGKVEGKTPVNVTIPKVPLDNLVSILPKDDDERVELELGNNALVATFEDETTRFVMRALDGAYLDVDKGIPTIFETKLRVSRLALLTACERIAIFAGDVENKQTRIEFENGRLCLSIYSLAVGKAADEVEILWSNRTDIDPMFFNVRYWQDVLKEFQSEQIEIGINGPTKPITMQPVDGIAMALISPLLTRGVQTERQKTA